MTVVRGDGRFDVFVDSSVGNQNPVWNCNSKLFIKYRCEITRYTSYNFVRLYYPEVYYIDI